MSPDVSTEQTFPRAVDGGASHRPWREGARAGLVATAAGALWSLIVDLIAGHPFRTWIFLGDGFVSLLGPAIPPRPIVAIIVFLAIMVLAFTVVGRLAILVAHRADKQPYMILIANFILTLLLLALFIWTAAFQTSRLGGEAWIQILGSPIVALWTLAFRVYRTHPSLAFDLRHVEDS